MKNKPVFDKYFCYKKSVQSPKEDIRFFKKIYKGFFKKSARIFREDFCGTFYVGYHWVKDHPQNKAIVIDKDKQPIEYGKKHHFTKLTASEKARIHIFNKDVLNKNLPKAEIISVSNFSYFIFKQRTMMLKYFKIIKKSLFKKGLFIIDVVGGPDCQGVSEEIVEHEDFNYYWDQDSFDPINNRARFYIHFKRKGEKKHKKAFFYDWRLWSIPELKDTLKEAGFSDIYVYWEQSDKKGEGTGNFKKSLKGDICDVWIAYLVCKA